MTNATDIHCKILCTVKEGKVSVSYPENKTQFEVISTSFTYM